MTFRRLSVFLFAFFTALHVHAENPPAGTWRVGEPIVTYWAGPGFPGGPRLDDKAAAQLAEGGWNLAWCRDEAELDAARRHNLRGLLTHPLLRPESLDRPEKRAELDALVERLRRHPALYAWHLVDEPSAKQFPGLGRLVAYLRERDPEHLAYINLLPTYASNEQLGTEGGVVPAYKEHLRLFVETVKPALLSYDHYQFTNSGDNPDYFLNLALVREKALASGLPFLNIVQASSWVPGSAASPQAPRVPDGDEVRYLVYTTLAYGARGISYYVYGYPAHEGGMVLPDGTPTPLFHAVKTLNREFAAIARELAPLKPLDARHAGMLPPGTIALPEAAPFRFDPPVSDEPYRAGDRVRGLLIGRFGPAGAEAGDGTHVLVVNLDYRAGRAVTLVAPGPLEVFDALAGQWTDAGGSRVELNLPGGGGKLLRLKNGK